MISLKVFGLFLWGQAAMQKAHGAVASTVGCKVANCIIIPLRLWRICKASFWKIMGPVFMVQLESLQVSSEEKLANLKIDDCCESFWILFAGKSNHREGRRHSASCLSYYYLYLTSLQSCQVQGASLMVGNLQSLHFGRSWAPFYSVSLKCFKAFAEANVSQFQKTTWKWLRFHRREKLPLRMSNVLPQLLLCQLVAKLPIARCVCDKLASFILADHGLLLPGLALKSSGFSRG